LPKRNANRIGIVQLDSCAKTRFDSSGMELTKGVTI